MQVSLPASSSVGQSSQGFEPMTYTALKQTRRLKNYCNYVFFLKKHSTEIQFSIL